MAVVLTNYDFSLANEVQMCPFAPNDSDAMKNTVSELEIIDASSIQMIQDVNNYEESLSFVANALGPAAPFDTFTLVEDFIKAQVRRAHRRRPKRTYVKNHRASKKSMKVWRKSGLKLNNRAASSSEKPKESSTGEAANNYPSKASCQNCLSMTH